jgi:hypothetical protein
VKARESGKKSHTVTFGFGAVGIDTVFSAATVDTVSRF